MPLTRPMFALRARASESVDTYFVTFPRFEKKMRNWVCIGFMCYTSFIYHTPQSSYVTVTVICFVPPRTPNTK